MEFILSSFTRKELMQLLFLLFSQWFILSGMRAKGRQTFCRIWSRTELSLPCHTTSSSFTSNSKFPNNLQRETLAMEEYKSVCVCVWMLKKSEEDQRTLQLWRFTSLKESFWAKRHHSNQVIYDGERQNWFWCLFSTFFCAESSY